MPSTPIALIDTLNELLDAEQTSLLRFMGEGYPYLNRATVEVRRPLEEMVTTIDRRVGRLADQIERLGGVPNLGPRGIDREEQYLAFLSLKFLLPKLVDAKKLLIERYENAIRAIKSSSEAKALLNELLEEHRSQLNILEQAAARVASQK
jgi:hypothetical protein